MSTTLSSEENYEETHVHAVYEQIASHFSSTRYKPWPIIEHFLKTLPPGAVGVDIGCGNGKYLAVNHDVYIVGSDRSPALATIAASNPQHRPHSVVVADILHLPHGAGTFDFALSIAVVHHLSTPARRRAAIAAVLEMVRPTGAAGAIASVAVEGGGKGKGRSEGGTDVAGGKALLYAWALEQEGSRRGWGAGDEQDIMVPWVRRTGVGAGEGRRKGQAGKARASGGGKGGRKGKENAGEERGAEMKGEEREEVKGEAEGKGEAKTEEETFQRYYHLYRRGELEEDVLAAGGEVVEAGYEKDNWWVVARRKGR